MPSVNELNAPQSIHYPDLNDDRMLPAQESLPAAMQTPDRWTPLWIGRFVRPALSTLWLALIILWDVNFVNISYGQSVEQDEEIEQLAEQTGVDAELVREMRAAGIPDAYISPTLAETFEAEMRQELDLSEAGNQPLAADAGWTLLAPYGTILRSCSSQNFPFLFVTLSVEENGVPVTDLTQDNFQCFENDTLQTDYFQVTPPQTGGGIRLADIVFLIDASGSMADEIAAVRANANAFATSLAASNIDFRLGLVRFGSDASAGPNPFVFNSGNLTADVELFRSFIASIGASGGFEPGFLALRMATQGFNFRPGAQKIFILITDEDSDDRNKQATIDLLRANDITVHTAVLCSFENSDADYCNETSVRGVTGGLLFDVVGPYDQILDTIAESTADSYILRYRSSNPTFDGTTRTIQCRITTPTLQESVTCSYIPGAAPQIALTPATIALNQSAIAEGTTPTVGVIVTDQVAPLVQTVTLYYRLSGSTGGYTALAMTPVGGDQYEATIPAVSTPGVDYYITATDGQVLSSLPTTDPGGFPFQIAVLPNQAPQIQHTPVNRASAGADVAINANVTDMTNRVAVVFLYWRRVGELLYIPVQMTLHTGDQYGGLIPGAEFTSDLEYYLRATDDLGVASTAGSADQPYVITVANPPLIFIPGIAGSRLKGPNDLFDLWISFLEPDDLVQELVKWLADRGIPGAGTVLGVAFQAMQERAKTLTFDSSSSYYRPELIAPDVLRKPFGLKDIYSGLLETLEAKGYQAYNLNVSAHLRPGFGCDESQINAGQKPTLFVFPYDWRRSNAETAERLKNYVACVQRFHPGSSVNILAHSMGGLVARRYILDNPTSHQVNKLITMGTPWLGSPKFIQVLETGDFDLFINLLIINSNRLKELVETFDGAHQLLPSEQYFALATPPFVEEGWDINNRNGDQEVYSYHELHYLLDQVLHPIYRPAAEAELFHAQAGQDRWEGDQSGVEYHYIVGMMQAETTVERVTAFRYCAFSNFICTPIHYFKYKTVRGDGTVPLESARRAVAGSRPDGENIQVHVVVPTQSKQDGEADHGGLPLSKTVQGCIEQILNDQACPNVLRPTGAVQGAGETDLDDLHQSESTFVSVVGVEAGLIADENGQPSGMYPDGTLVDYATGATFFPTAGAAFAAVLTSDEAYTVTFRAPTTPLFVEILQGSDTTTSTAVRYQDLVLPTGAAVQLLILPPNGIVLRYDSDNDGIPDAEIPPTITVTGTAAQDTEPPQIRVDSTLNGQQLLVTLTTQDSGSGVANTYYSLDGVQFQRYVQPFTLEFNQATVHVFAEDQVANRSGIFTFRLVTHIYLPLMQSSSSEPPSPPLNRPPFLPGSPQPVNGAQIQLSTERTLVLSWSGGDPEGDRTTYDLYVEIGDDTPDELIANDQLATAYNLQSVVPGKDYFWRIVARDQHGTVTPGPVWRFSTGSAATETPTAIPTSSPTSTPTGTPSITSTPTTERSTATSTSTLTATPTPTLEPTQPANPTATPTHTPTSTSTVTPTPTDTMTPTPTNTPIPTPKFADIGGRVGHDQNQDGFLHELEPGIADVVVRLLDDQDRELATTSTAAGFGNWHFYNLVVAPKTTLKVVVDETTIPTDYQLTTANLPATILVSPGETHDGYNFGYAPHTIQLLTVRVAFQSRDNVENRPQNVPIQLAVKDQFGTRMLLATDWITVEPAAKANENWGTAIVDVSAGALATGQTYQVFVKGAMHLTKQVIIPLIEGAIIDLTNPVLNPDGVLWACDIDQNNQVTEPDVTIVIAHLQNGDTPPAHPDPNSEIYRSDVDGDGVIDITDFSICANNVGKVGDSGMQALSR